jgi:hypothetical protein
MQVNTIYVCKLVLTSLKNAKARSNNTILKTTTQNQKVAMQKQKTTQKKTQHEGINT